MSAQDSKKIKRVYLTYHGSNGNRRVRYNQKDFDVLEVSFTVDDKTRIFHIPAKNLPVTDSIHLKYDSLTKSISWSPKDILPYVVEVKL